MTNRDGLHDAIDRLPDESLEEALRMLEQLAFGSTREQPSGKSFYETASPEEFAAALGRIAEGNQRLPVLVPDAFERESLYEERF